MAKAGVESIKARIDPGVDAIAQQARDAGGITDEARKFKLGVMVTPSACPPCGGDRGGRHQACAHAARQLAQRG